MAIFYLLDNWAMKFFLFFVIVNLIIQQEINKKEYNNDLEDLFCQTICQLLFFSINYNCSMNFFSNDNFYNDILEINSNVNLLMNIKKPKLDNIFLLLGIIPFLKNNSTLFYKIKDKRINNIFKKTSKKKLKNKIIKIGYNDLFYFNNKIQKLLYYKWELIPRQFMLNNLRYIINNYYNEQNLVVFQESLNMNYKSYIQNNFKELSDKEIIILLSKYFINFIYKRKYWYI